MCAAGGLQTLGVTSGDIVCVVAPNHVDYLVTFSLINEILKPTSSRTNCNRNVFMFFVNYNVCRSTEKKLHADGRGIFRKNGFENRHLPDLKTQVIE